MEKTTKAKGNHPKLATAYFIHSVVFSVFISVCCWSGKLMPLLWFEPKPRAVWHVFETEARAIHIYLFYLSNTLRNLLNILSRSLKSSVIISAVPVISGVKVISFL